MVPNTNFYGIISSEKSNSLFQPKLTRKERQIVVQPTNRSPANTNNLSESQRIQKCQWRNTLMVYCEKSSLKYISIDIYFLILKLFNKTLSKSFIGISTSNAANAPSKIFFIIIELSVYI